MALSSSLQACSQRRHASAQTPQCSMPSAWRCGPVDITGYEVIVTKEVEDDPNGFSRPTYDVHLPASVNSLSVPAEFLEADTVYELEVLALEESGNQTISVGFFKTA